MIDLASNNRKHAWANHVFTEIDNAKILRELEAWNRTTPVQDVKKQFVANMMLCGELLLIVEIPKIYRFERSVEAFNIHFSTIINQLKKSTNNWHTNRVLHSLPSRSQTSRSLGVIIEPYEAGFGSGFSQLETNGDISIFVKQDSMHIATVGSFDEFLLKKQPMNLTLAFP